MTNAEEYPYKELTERIIGAAIEVHRALGPGLLEAAYETCLAWELTDRGVSYRRQLEVPILYKGRRLDANLRIDLLVEESVVVELKSVDRVIPIHESQLLTYLRLTGMHLGLLINFNVPKLTEGIIRRIL